jgi:hypothetical protein
VKVVAHHPRQDSIELWIEAAVDEVRRTITIKGGGRKRTFVLDGEPAGRVPAFTGPDRGVWVQELHELQAGVTYHVEVQNEELARFKTLPAQLPLRVLAGSCFSVENDAVETPATEVTARTRGTVLRWLRDRVSAGFGWLVPDRPTAGRPGGLASAYRAFLAAGDSALPDIKILMGDQVYVDAPFNKFLRRSIPSDTLEKWVGESYRESWDALGEFLSLGSNICLTEDHEYWNDYPNKPAPTWWALRHAETASSMAAIAGRYAELIQRPRSTSSFVIGPEHDPQLSFFIADTRANRTQWRAWNPVFMAVGDLEELERWVEALTCPGVLVLGQPLLTTRGSLWDKNLPAYRTQYRRLCDAILRSPHDVVVLSGDVHFGRVGRISAPGSRGQGVQILEVVSSPMAVLDHAGGHFDIEDPPEALQQLPVGRRRSGGPSGAVEFLDVVPDAVDRGSCEDHFVTVDFVAQDSSVRVEIAAWMVRRRGTDGLGVPEQAMKCDFSLT